MDEEKPDYIEHRKRLRGKFLRAGGAALNDYELLELLLTYAIPRKDVKGVAKELLKRFKCMAGVLNASVEELKQIDGVGESSAVLFQLVRELYSKWSHEKLTPEDLFSSPAKAAEFAKSKLAHLKDEAMLAIYVNSKNRICGFARISEGTIDHAVVYPRKIVKLAFEHNASGIILAHNHPSGECQPSSDDILLTENVKKAAIPLDLRVLDHIIVGSSGYFSFVENSVAF